MAYLNMQQYEQEITHLENYSSDDIILGALAKGGIGDSFTQLGQPQDALSYYEQAINHSENNYTTPKYLYKAGITALELGEKEKALQFFQRIKDDFSTVEEAANIDVFIGMAKSQ